MAFSNKTLQTLEFDKICAMLAEHAHTDGARAMAARLTPTDDTEEILRRQRRTTDAKRLLDVKGTPSFGYVRDVSEICERADKGAVLSPRELLDVANVLRTSRLLVDYCHGNHIFDTVLDEIFDRLSPDRHLEERITRAIIAEDLIADEASSALADIRRKIRATNSRIKDTLQKYVQGGTHAKYLQENIVTSRNGRYVIPVKTEYKNEVKGLVHDTSSSGATLFIEPMAVVEANNELRVLQSKEQHEIERILAELSEAVSNATGVLTLNYYNIVTLSFCFACAELSAAMNAAAPALSEDGTFRLIRARHPLIDRDRVVPINVALGGECGYDTVIITGPNTGGKTVTLKTLGLFALMAQSGLHIPADQESIVPVLRSVLVDLGDEQSIEQSLSTFSSHMVNIVEIMKQVGEHSLVLFDELGVGTDPVEGAALAVSVIESVRAAGALCAATTHYAELKAFALNTPGVRNASCEFDVETLRPTYKLIIGTPGKSNAFAISEKLGLSTSIIGRAQELISADNRHFEDVIGQLEQSRMEMEQHREETARLRAEYEQFKRQSEQKIAAEVAKAEKELEAARVKANSMVQSAKASYDFILEQMEKVRKSKDSAKMGEEMDAAKRAVREHLKQNGDKFDPVQKPEEDDRNYVLPRALRKGDEVIIRSLGTKGVLVDAPDKSGNAQVKAGILTTRVNIKDLKLVEEESALIKDGKKNKVSTYSVQKNHDFKDEIDLRGMNGEEAWFAVDKYLDSAILYGFRTVRLIHGKGTGALRQAMQNFLRTDKRVASFRRGQYGEGDSGVTVVELK